MNRFHIAVFSLLTNGAVKFEGEGKQSDDESSASDESEDGYEAMMKQPIPADTEPLVDLIAKEILEAKAMSEVSTAPSGRGSSKRVATTPAKSRKNAKMSA